MKKNEKVIYKSFSDFGCSGVSYYERERGKANKELAKFLNEHPYIAIVSLEKRQRLIENAGNGNEYYDFDLVFRVNVSHLNEEGELI